jgi:hypothetical protein
MKKRIITTMAILTMLFGFMMNTVQAQIFLSDEDMHYSMRANTLPEDLPYIPKLDSTYDQYAPLGGEFLVLGCLGGLYLLRKKSKDDQ